MRTANSLAAALLCLVLFPFAATAENEPAQEQTGEKVELVITYSREEMPKEDVAANITVITQEEIKRIPASNAAEVLQYVPGVYVEFNGGLGSQASASIQGSDIRHVAVYQDGVPLNQLNNPMTDLSYVPIAAIERIEVYKGAASSAWGSALGGVINIITKDPDLTKPFTGEIQSSYGQFNTTRNSGTVSGSIDRFGYLVSLAQDQSDGFVSHMRFRQDAAYAKLNYLLGDTSRLNFVYSYDEGSHQSPTPLLAGMGFWEDLYQKRSYGRLLFETSLTEGLAWTIEGRYLEADISDHYRPPQPPPWGEGFDYSEWRWGISSRLRLELEDVNHLVLGFDGDWGTYEFSRFTRDHDSGNWALYVNDTFNLGHFSFTAGIRYDNNLDFGSELSPMGGVVYHFPAMQALARFQVAKGFSAPPGSWLNDPVYGNPDLKAETGINYQLGGEMKPFEFLKIELNLFRSEVDNLINFDYDTFHFVNIDSATRQGIEGRIGAVFSSGPASGLALSFGGSFIDVRDNDTGEVIDAFPRTLYDVTASHTYKYLTNSIVGRYVFHNSSSPETHDEVFVFDYLLKVRLPSICETYTPSLFFAVHDLTDAGYVYRTHWPQPGRWVEGGAVFEF
jgi:vitamin B12 transporter